MSSRTAGPLATGLILMAALAGCGPQSATPTATAETSTPGAESLTNPFLATPSASDAMAAADASGLIPAQYPQCDLGSQILSYLATGDNGGDPGMDQLFASYV